MDEKTKCAKAEGELMFHQRRKERLKSMKEVSNSCSSSSRQIIHLMKDGEGKTRYKHKKIRVLMTGLV